MMLILLTTLVALVLVYPSYTEAAFNTVEDQYLVFDVSYDPATDKFYDMTGTGSEWIEITETEPGVFVFLHGRDGYKGAVVPGGTVVRYLSQPNSEPGSVFLAGKKQGGTISIATGRKNTSLWMFPIRQFDGWADSGGGCNVAATTADYGVASQMLVQSTADPFLNRWCLSRFYISQNSQSTFPTDIRQVGYIERMFKLDKLALSRAAYDSYQGNFSIVTNEYMRLGYSDLDSGREAYHYTINVHIKPSIQRFEIDHSVLDLDVARVKDRIVGEGYTGFTASGSFDKYQPFTVTITSLNACGASLCLMNGHSSIPYEVEVFDPVSLLKKKIMTSGGSVTLNADREHKMNGTLGFKFNVIDNGQSGVYVDVITVRLALVL